MSKTKLEFEAELNKLIRYYNGLLTSITAEKTAISVSEKMLKTNMEKVYETFKSNVITSFNAFNSACVFDVSENTWNDIKSKWKIAIKSLNPNRYSDEYFWQSLDVGAEKGLLEIKNGKILLTQTPTVDSDNVIQCGNFTLKQKKTAATYNFSLEPECETYFQKIIKYNCMIFLAKLYKEQYEKKIGSISYESIAAWATLLSAFLDEKEKDGDAKKALDKFYNSDEGKEYKNKKDSLNKAKIFNFNADEYKLNAPTNEMIEEAYTFKDLPEYNELLYSKKLHYLAGKDYVSDLSKVPPISSILELDTLYETNFSSFSEMYDLDNLMSSHENCFKPTFLNNLKIIKNLVQHLGEEATE